MSAKLTAREVAVRLNSDEKTVRRALRAMTPKDARPGSGGSWEILDDERVLDAIERQINSGPKRTKVSVFGAEFLADDE